MYSHFGDLSEDFSNSLVEKIVLQDSQTALRLIALYYHVV